MTGTGNDIVSLSAINSTRTKQPGFYSKILSKSEQALYNERELTVLPFENFVWLLWSIKESAFKYLQRNNPGLIFSPTKSIVQQLQVPLGYVVSQFDETEKEGTGFDGVPAIKGTINVGTKMLYSRSIIYKKFIASVVNENENFENTCWGIKTINKPDSSRQSIIVREFLVSRLHSLFHMDNLAVGKNHYGFPILLEGSGEIAIPVSLSHHDHLVAYSFQSEGFQNNAQL